MAITYEVELEEVGGITNRFSNISVSDYALSGLNAGIDYIVRVRSVDTTAGVSIFSLWASQAFTSTAQIAPVNVDLGKITNSQTLYAVSVTLTVPPVNSVEYEVRLTEVGQSSVVYTGIVDSSYALTGLMEGTDYTVAVRSIKTSNDVVYFSTWSPEQAFTSAGSTAPVNVDLAKLALTQTLYAVTASLTAPELPIAAHTWLVRVYDTSDESLVIEQVTGDSNFTPSGLFQGTTYRIEVTGFALGGVSDTVSATFDTVTTLSVSLTKISHVQTVYAAASSLTDPNVSNVDIISVNYSYENGNLIVTGETANPADSITIEGGGITLPVVIDGVFFRGVYAAGNLVLPYHEELDGSFVINSGYNNEPLRIR